MYEDLLKDLRGCREGSCQECRRGNSHVTFIDCMTALMEEAADAIEKLSHYAAQMDKLREDGWYLLQETAGTYGPITMKMPIPEPLSCDDVLAIINGEPPKEE